MEQQTLPLIKRLHKIEGDPTLLQLVGQIRAVLKQGDLPAFVSTVRCGLHHLTRSHLAEIFNSKHPSPSLALLPSHHTRKQIPLDANPLSSRIMLYHPVPTHTFTDRICDHIAATVQQLFNKIWSIQNFSLHKYSRSRLLSNDGIPTHHRARVPVFISSRAQLSDALPESVLVSVPQQVPDLAQFSTRLAQELARPFSAESEEAQFYLSLDYELYSAYLALLLGLSLSTEAQTQVKHVLAKRVSDLSPETLESLLRFKNTPAPLAICSIPVSDQLSNVDHGTVMLFYEDNAVPPLELSELWEIEEMAFEYMDAVWKIEREEEAREEFGQIAAHEAGAQLVFVEMGVRRALELENKSPHLNRIIRGSLRYCHLFLEERSAYIPPEWLPWSATLSSTGDQPYTTRRVVEWLKSGAKTAWDLAVARETRNASYEEFEKLSVALDALKVFPGSFVISVQPTLAAFSVPEGMARTRAETVAWELTRWYLAALSNALAWAGPDSHSRRGLQRIKHWAANIETFHGILVIFKVTVHGVQLRIINGYDGEAQPGAARPDMGTRAVLLASARRLDAEDRFTIRAANPNETRTFTSAEQQAAVTDIELRIRIAS